MITDSAVGAQEENNLRHLVTNLGPDVPRNRVVPFLTTKHSLEFCLAYADQVVQHQFPALVVLGGDKHVGRARSVEHAWQLRRLIRDRHPDLPLGGWANPASDAARQVAFVGGGEFTADFYLTQIVSHHRLADVEAFLGAADRAGVAAPGMFGVFYYRSANPATLEVLSQFLPVPIDGLRAEFAAGATPGGRLRPLDPRAAGAGRAPLLRQQPAAHPHRQRAARDSRSRRPDDERLAGRLTRGPSPTISRRGC